MLLGGGVTSQVYSAKLRGEPVAVKTLRFPKGTAKEAREAKAEKFWQEADKQYRLRHDHIVAV